MADLTRGDGSADVTLDYVVGGVDAGATVGARVLSFGPAMVEELTVDGRPTTLTSLRGVAWGVEVRVGGGPRGAGPEVPPLADGEGRLVVRYTVPRAADPTGAALHVQIPLVTLDLPPAGARPGLFEAELRVPEAWAVVEGFPTAMRRVEPAPDAGPGAPAVHRAALPVVPAVVGLRARTDGRWRPGLPAVLDAFALACLAGFFVVGWRFVRRTP